MNFRELVEKRQSDPMDLFLLLFLLLLQTDLSKHL